MLVIGRPARVVSAVAVAALALAGCSSDGDDDAPPPDGLISVTTMRGAMLQAAEIGPTWAAPEESAAAVDRLPPICAGPAAAPAFPPGAQVVSQPLADEGQQGAQSLTQIGLVYDDKAGAEAGLAALRAVADGCPATVNQAAAQTADRNEPAYVETARTTALNEGGWTGFVVQRTKQYEAAHPGTADTAVVVLSSRNIVFVDTYAVYRLGTPSAASQFDADWKKLVGTVLNRVG